MRLTNYDLDALVQIEAKGLGLVFRAASAQSYQAAKLIIAGSGPMPSLTVERYAVIWGNASRPVRTQYPERFQSDTLYRVHLEVSGDAFALYIQGKLVDYWSDPRLSAGRRRPILLPGRARPRCLGPRDAQHGFRRTDVLPAVLDALAKQRCSNETMLFAAIGPTAIERCRR